MKFKVGVAAWISVFRTSWAVIPNPNSPTFEVTDFEASMQPNADSYGSTLSMWVNQTFFSCETSIPLIDGKASAEA